MAGKTERIQRLLAIVAAVKTDTYPSAPGLAAAWDVSTKTIKRDIQLLRERLDAPIYYDERSHGYFLEDRSWRFPVASLQGEELFAALFSEALSAGALPESMRQSLETAMSLQLAAADPTGVDDTLLRAVVYATGAQPGVDDTLFDTVCFAWRHTQSLSVLYDRADHSPPVRRTVDVHALFLADGAWYARVFCHLRQAVRSLALHRLRNVRLVENRFTRSEEILREVRSGRIFDYEVVNDVVAECDPQKAAVIAEREWFTGQRLEQWEDGRLLLRYPGVPKTPFLWWVLSYAGHIRVRKPETFRREIRDAALAIAEKHQ